MLQFNEQYVENENYMSNIINEATKVLEHRKKLYSRVVKTKGVPIERYISKTATSYFAGKTPQIEVKQELDEKKISLIKELFNKVIGKNDDQVGYQLMLDYINEYNDFPEFIYSLAKDYHELGACYFITYETEQNEVVFAKTSALQCVALYDYSTPTQLIGGLRIYQEKDDKGNLQNIAVLTLKDKRRYYKNGTLQSEEYKEDKTMVENIKWKLTPFYAIENVDGLSIFEPVIELIDNLENVLKNERNTFEYNDDAKLKVTGYVPEHNLFNADGTENVERKKEDEKILKAKVFYTPDGDGDISWVLKNVNDTAIQNYTKQLVDFIFMLAMIPNMNDISFSNSDSGKAIEQKFFALEQILIETEKLFKKELLRMYENIVDRINLKKRKNYDFRDIEILFSRNLPVAKNDIASAWLSLRDLISDETIIKNLPYELDAKTELAKKQEQSDENMEEAINKMKSMKNDKEEVEEKVGE